MSPITKYGRPSRAMPERCPYCRQYLKGHIKRCPEFCPICARKVQCELPMGHRGQHAHWDVKAKATAYWHKGMK